MATQNEWWSRDVAATSTPTSEERKQAATEARAAAAERRAEEANRRAAASEGRASAEFEAKYGVRPAPGDTSKTGDEYLATLEPALAAQVKAIAEGRRPFPTGAALRSSSMQQLVAAATQYDPSLDAANAATRVATRKDFTSGPSSKNIASINTAIGHLVTLQQAAKELDNSDFKLWNTVGNWAATQTGDPRVKKFEIARQAVASELTRAFRGTGGSLTEVKDWENSLDTSGSPEQLNAATTMGTELLLSRLESMNDNYTRGMGRSSDVMQLLSPHNVAKLEALQTGRDASEVKAPPAGGAQTSAPETATELRAGAGEKYVSEEAKRAASRLQQAFDAGATRDEINTLAKEIGSGLPDPAQLDAAIQFRDRGGKGAYVVPAESERPLAQRAVGAVAESPVGAYAIGAGGALTGGLTDELAGLVNGPDAEERARFARQFSQAENPMASLAGEVTGGMMASIPAIRGMQAALPGMAATRAAILGEAALGGVTGAGEAEPGSRMRGALFGTTLGAAGGMLPGAVSRVMKPKTPEAVRALRQAGVKDMSVGQTLGVPELEAGVAGVLPGGGDVALHAQRKAFEQFQDAYINDALKPLGLQLPAGLKPTQQMQHAQEAFNSAYEAARSQMRVVPDGEMWNDLMDFSTRLASDEYSEAAATRLQKLLRDQVQRRIQGPIGGDEYKSLSSLLGKRANQFAKRQDQEMVDGVAELQRIVDDAARRHSPAEAVDLMDRADTGYGILARAEEAARTISNAPGEFTPQQALGAVKKGDTTARNRALLRGEARGQQLAQAGVEALGKTPPEAVSRVERGLGVLGSALTSPLNVAMGVANAPGIRRVLNTAIAGERPAAVQSVADLIRRRPEYLAAIGGASAMEGVRNRPEDLADLRSRYGIADPSLLGWAPEGGY